MIETAVQMSGGRGVKPPGTDPRLRGRKEIGRWFGVDERTVKRWEATPRPAHPPRAGRGPGAVFAYEAELAAWLQSRATTDLAEPAATVAAQPQAAKSAGRTRSLGIIALVAVLVLAIAAWQGWQLAAARHQETSERVANVRRLARSQIAALSDRLEKQPGTLRLRARLAGEAAALLGRVAALPDASPDLRREAAEAYRRLAIVQSATDRPSLRDRPAARASLDRALRLIAADAGAAARRLRARLLIDAARHAAADGAVASAPALLAAAAANAADPPPDLRDDLLLAQSEVAQWQGDYARPSSAPNACSARVDGGGGAGGLGAAGAGP